MRSKEVVCSSIPARSASRASQVVEQIAISLQENACRLKYPGYGNGLLSISLFSAYYALFSGQRQFTTAAAAYFERAISAISVDIYAHKISYFRELIEMAFFVQFVKSNNLISFIDTDILAALDTRIDAFFKIKLREGELNHFGALYASEYYLTRIDQDPLAADRLVKLVEALEHFAIRDSAGYCWKWPFSKNDGIYLGMICGSARVIRVLSELYWIGIKQQEVIHLINRAADFILSQSQKANPGYFPVKVHTEGRSDFMLDADLAVSCALWETYRITGRKDVLRVMECTLALCCQRRDLAGCRVGDASIQYGSTGLALRFEGLYRKSGLQDLKNASEYWHQQTMLQQRFDNDTAGFKASYNQMHVHTNIAFHEGIAGIGIGLMCYADASLPLPTQLI